MWFHHVSNSSRQWLKKAENRCFARKDRKQMRTCSRRLGLGLELYLYEKTKLN